MQLLLDDGDKHVGRHGAPHLRLHRVLAVAQEMLDAQVLDPFEEQLDLPTALVLTLGLASSDVAPPLVVVDGGRPWRDWPRADPALLRPPVQSRECVSRVSIAFVVRTFDGRASAASDRKITIYDRRMIEFVLALDEFDRLDQEQAAARGPKKDHWQ